MLSAVQQRVGSITAVAVPVIVPLSSTITGIFWLALKFAHLPLLLALLVAEC
jgi:hypothetical protein